MVGSSLAYERTNGGWPRRRAREGALRLAENNNCTNVDVRSRHVSHAVLTLEIVGISQVLYVLCPRVETFRNTLFVY